MNSCKRNISCFTLLVRDIDEAVEYYVNVLGFHLSCIYDGCWGETCAEIMPEGGNVCIKLEKVNEIDEVDVVGYQCCTHVFATISTSSFHDDFVKLKLKGVDFVEEPWSDMHGKVVAFMDLYGNKWELREIS